MKTYLQLVRESIKKRDTRSVVGLLTEIRRKLLAGEDEYPSRSTEKDDISNDPANRDDRPAWRMAFQEGRSYLDRSLSEIRRQLAKSNSNPEETKYRLQALTAALDLIPEDIGMLVDIMLHHSDEGVRRTACDVLCDRRYDLETNEETDPLCLSPYSRYVRRHIEDKIHRFLGKRMGDHIPRLIAACKDEELTAESLKRALLPRSRLIRDNCDLVPREPERKKFFRAYEFSNKHLEQVVRDYFGQKPPGFEMQTAGKGFAALTVAGELTKKLLEASFAVFDLSPSQKPELNPSGDAKLPNYNVVLELGLAMALGTPWIVLVRKGTFPISDLQGWYWIEYEELREIPEKAEERFRQESWSHFLRSFE